MLVKSNFSFSHNVFHRYICSVRQNAAFCGNDGKTVLNPLCGNGLRTVLHHTLAVQLCPHVILQHQSLRPVQAIIYALSSIIHLSASFNANILCIFASTVMFGTMHNTADVLTSNYHFCTAGCLSRLRLYKHGCTLNRRSR